MTTSRERILARIRASLSKTRDNLTAEAQRAPRMPPPFVHTPQDDLAAQFAAELSQLEGRPHHCANDAAALAAIGDILRTHQAATAITWNLDHIGLPGLAALLSEAGIHLLDPAVAHTGKGRAERLQAIEPAPICISGADAGIAESGTIVLLGGAGRPRLASLLAPVHIAVLRTARLARGLGEALADLQAQHGADVFASSSSMIMITGPSRTADIELTLTLGVHGPREIHVVLIG